MRPVRGRRSRRSGSGRTQEYSQFTRPRFGFWAGLWPAAQKAESRASGSGTAPSFGGQGGGDLVLGLSSSLALLSLPLSSSSATKFSRPAAQHPISSRKRIQQQRRRRQKAEQADWGLVLSLSSGLALLSLPLSSSSATKFLRPAAHHPFWAGLRRRRQKAEQVGRGLVLSLSSGLALLSLPLSSSSSTKFSRPAAQHPRPFWAGLRRRRQEAGSRPGTTPSFRGGGGVIWFSAAAVVCLLLALIPAF
jgi:hypothetical protein